ncbi:MAG: hypothetical protein KGH75_10250, partial [Rhodospirillales bacterium]|nr:hypothetical protein [Rhodospirillales bacterium]
MNLIKKAIANGFPDKLLIPVAPPGVLYKRKEGEDANGKAIYEVSESKGKFPGVPYDDHHWGPCQWDIGTTDPVTRNIADENGCNVGLILGKPSEEHKGFGFVAVDIDLQEYGDSIPQTQL